MKKVLIIRFSAIGDIVLTTPLLRMLKNTYPECKVDFLVKEKYREILENNPYINKILILKPGNFWRLIKEIRKRKYDKVIDLQMSQRSLLICFLSGNYLRQTYNTRRFKRFMLINFRKNFYNGITPVPLRFLEAVKELKVNDDGGGADLFFSDTQKKSVINRLKSDGILNHKSLIVLAPGAGRKTKRWPVERYTELGRYFVKQGYTIVTIGGTMDVDICKQITNISKEIISYAGELSLQQVAALLSMAKLLISNDTGVMHIGTAVCRNVIALFGPTTEDLGFFPFRGNAIVIEKLLNCKPCSYHGTNKCPQKHFKCMNDISVEEVIKKVQNILQRN